MIHKLKIFRMGSDFLLDLTILDYWPITVMIGSLTAHLQSCQMIHKFLLLEKCRSIIFTAHFVFRGYVIIWRCDQEGGQ